MISPRAVSTDLPDNLRHPVPLRGAFRDRHLTRGGVALDAAASGAQTSSQGGLTKWTLRH